MRTIETIATIMPDGTIIARGPAGLPPGEHQVVIVVAEAAASRRTLPLRNFPVDTYGPWPENLSLRREDMYDDWGR